MQTLPILVVSLLSFVAAYVLVAAVRRYAIRADIVDRPNDRTLHEGSVARGGGLAVVFLVLVAIVAATAWAGLSAELAWPLAFVTLSLGALGWSDDHYDLPVMVRFIAHFLVAGCVVTWLGAFVSIDFGSGLVLPLGVMSIPLTVVWLVWMANLYNFMDGSDGLAAVQGMVGAAAMGIWFYWAGDKGLAWICLVLVAGLSGFLVWNWSPARVFMGDVGSIMLGGLFAALSVVAVTRYDMPVVAFVILFSIFISDATLTLVRRVVQREEFWRPHRSHYYQRAVQSGISHARVATLAALLSIVEAGLATMVIVGVVEPWLGLFAGLSLLAGIIIAVHRLEASALE